MSDGKEDRKTDIEQANLSAINEETAITTIEQSDEQIEAEEVIKEAVGDGTQEEVASTDETVEVTEDDDGSEEKAEDDADTDAFIDDEEEEFVSSDDAEEATEDDAESEEDAEDDAEGEVVIDNEQEEVVSADETVEATEDDAGTEEVAEDEAEAVIDNEQEEVSSADEAEEESVEEAVGDDEQEESVEEAVGDDEQEETVEEAISDEQFEEEASDEEPEEDVSTSEAEEVSEDVVNDVEQEVAANAEDVVSVAVAVDDNEQAEVLKPWFKYYDDEIPHSIEYPKVNIAQFLIDSAKKYPTHTAVEFLGNKLSYEQLYLKADQLAQYLGSIGVKKGERVAIMLPNTPQAVIAYYGVLLAGAIVVQTNPLYVERELKYQLKDSGAVVLITLDLLINRVKNVWGEKSEDSELSFLKKVIVTSIADGLKFPKNVLYKLSQRKNIPAIPDAALGYVSWKSIFKQNVTFERPILETGDSLAIIQYTGGTTGTPKGVMLSHANLVANTMQTSAWCYKSKIGEEKYLAALPLFHVFGLTVLMNYSVFRAGELILLPKFEVDKVLSTIEKKRPSIFPGAPTMYIAVLQAARNTTKKLDLSSINICISGSAALPLEVQEQFEAYTGGRLVEGYGLSETSPVTHANPIWGNRKIGTIGLPFPDTEAAIIDPNTGKFLGVNEIGELVIKGPQVMLGYWNRLEATEQSFINGWFRTGDMGKMDEDGYFSIVDRIKDIIIASGFNIYPREIEEILYEHPAIAEAAAVGVKDEYRGETVKAFIVLKTGESVTEQELDAYCRSKLAAFKVPRYYEFRESLPKTMVGKILKRKLQDEG